MFPKWLDTNFLPMLVVKTLEVWMTFKMLPKISMQMMLDERFMQIAIFG